MVGTTADSFWGHAGGKAANLRQRPVAANELRMVGVDVGMLTVHQVSNHALSRSSSLTDEVLYRRSQPHL